MTQVQQLFFCISNYTVRVCCHRSCNYHTNDSWSVWCVVLQLSNESHERFSLRVAGTFFYSRRDNVTAIFKFDGVNVPSCFHILKTAPTNCPIFWPTKFWLFFLEMKKRNWNSIRNFSRYLTLNYASKTHPSTREVWTPESCWMFLVTG